MAERKPTVNVDPALHARARAAVRLMRTKGRPDYTMSTFTDEAFAGQLREIETIYNDGHAIMPDPKALAPGRTAK